ncbi:hypothetical protein BDV93DRAFT_553122 [Ceratobasidium sp. AG-I]|nr:hypothetical protein BDV93DRAFT_553122 [Ceratobasidium sp. AG-I]
MAKSRNPKGKEPVRTSGAPYDGGDNDTDDQLTREAQAHARNRNHKKLVPDNAYSSDEERTKLEDESNYDADADVMEGEHYASQTEDKAMSDWEEELADEEASIQELQELIRAKQAVLRRRGKAGAGAAPSIGRYVNVRRAA